MALHTIRLTLVRKGYRVAAGLVLSIALAGGLLMGILALLQERMAFHPSRVVEYTPSALGLDYREVRITSADGEALTGWWLPAEPDAPCLLFLHGNAGNISHRLYQLRALRGAGLAVLIIDYRGYGASTGSPSEEGLLLDARAAWEDLTGELGVPPERIVLYGESIGSAPALGLASRLAGSGREPAGLVLEGAFTSALDMARRAFPFLPLRLILRLRMDNRAAIRSLRRPILFIHGTRDEIVPLAMGRELHREAADPRSRMVEVPGAMHNSVWMTDPDGLAEQVAAFAAGITGPRDAPGEDPAPGR